MRSRQWSQKPFRLILVKTPHYYKGSINFFVSIVLNNIGNIRNLIVLTPRIFKITMLNLNFFILMSYRLTYI